MIDIHTHILPHIDDGAANSAVSVSIIEKELSQGVTQVVLTSHYYGKRRSPQQFLERRNEAYQKIKNKIPAGISVRLGAEIHFTGMNMPDFEELCELSIEGTKYILIELPFTTAWRGDLLQCLSDFIYDSGYTPIIAHVERYQEVWKNPALVNELIEMGCLIQINAESLFRGREKKLVLKLLEHGQVHCIGSDTHDTENRAPNLAKAKAWFEKRKLGKTWETLQGNMQCVLDDKLVERPKTKPVKKFLWAYV
jgi:protein-tyrosine phosphatase